MTNRPTRHPAGLASSKGKREEPKESPFSLAMSVDKTLQDEPEEVKSKLPRHFSRLHVYLRPIEPRVTNAFLKATSSPWLDFLAPELLSRSRLLAAANCSKVGEKDKKEETTAAAQASERVTVQDMQNIDKFSFGAWLYALYMPGSFYNLENVYAKDRPRREQMRDFLEDESNLFPNEENEHHPQRVSALLR